jgi:hypothetical protein
MSQKASDIPFRNHYMFVSFLYPKGCDALGTQLVPEKQENQTLTWKPNAWKTEKKMGR